ncbi:MAG TPA: oligopeptide transporter, OPT family [Candidatus Xenobia bacterium]|jgi:putative OPT family oligopeptide transporter
MSPHQEYLTEINGYVVFWGLFFAAIFALAVGYLCLKIGQTVDAFAPVSILAMGMAAVLNRKDAFPENVHIQAIASAGTNILGGAMFIVPAFFILKLNGQLGFAKMACPIVLGGLLGVLICTVFRRYFCVEMHAAYPFPAGRAAAEVLTSGEGNKARLMVISGLVALVYDFILNSFGWWQEVISSASCSLGKTIVDNYKLVFTLDTDAALLGIGYFTGLRYAAIISAGAFFSWFVCMPVVYFLGGEHAIMVHGQQMTIAQAPVDVVFKTYVRHIGIGMLAMAGIIGLLSMSKVIANVARTALSELGKKHAEHHEALLRTEQDIPMGVLVAGIISIALLFTLFFNQTCSQSPIQTVLALVIVLVFALLLSVVGISSIAFTGSEPVSGMTIFMIVVAAVIMGAAGLHGEAGTIAVLMMAAFLCTTLGVAGNFMSELKVAYLLGATPRKMQQWQLVSCVLSAFISVGVIFVLNNAYGFTGQGALAAPQANAMAAITKPLMEGGTSPWPLYLAGALFAVVLWMMEIPPLAFALGAYLPMEISTPLLVGGIIAHFLSGDSLKHAQGETIASGLIAGGALGGLLSAVTRIMGYNWFLDQWVDNPLATLLGVVVYLILCAWLYLRASKIEAARV